jgi:hypothetical protein
MQPVSRQLLDKHIPANMQRWELCSLWATLQLVARLHNNYDNRGGCFLCGPCRRIKRGYRITEGTVRAASKAGLNTSTVTLRVVGGDENGSLESETVNYGRESNGTRTRE